MDFKKGSEKIMLRELTVGTKWSCGKGSFVTTQYKKGG